MRFRFHRCLPLFLDKFKDVERKPFLKIGMELYYAAGPEIVKELKRRGFKIFLDLKLHDIPNTVKKAMKVLSNLDVDMVNVHAAGTVEMMRAALEGLTREDGTRPLLIAVTQLTSTSEKAMREQLLIDATINDTIAQYAQNAKEAGLDGVVCSPLEARLVKDACGEGVHDRHSRHSFCRRRQRRSGRCASPTRPCPRDRIGLYRGGSADHGSRRSRGSLRTLREGFSCSLIWDSPNTP